jgi:hypothetical protein
MALDLEAHTRLATASQVRAWVEHLASDDLARRAARVAEIENESRSERVSVATVLATPPRTKDAAAAYEPKARQRPRGERYGLAALLAGAMLSAAGGGAALLSGRIAPLSRGELRVPSAAVAPIGSALPPVEAALPSKLGSSAESAGPISAHMPSSSSVRQQRASDVKPRPGRSSIQSSATEAACDPPYYADSKGHVIYKPECFQ